MSDFEWSVCKVIAGFAILLLVVMCSGCAAIPISKPKSADCGWSHTSHPLLGAPFGPANEEDTLDTLGCRVRTEQGRVFIETGLSYRLRDGGFYGDDFIFQSYVGVKVWERR